MKKTLGDEFSIIMEEANQEVGVEHVLTIAYFYKNLLPQPQ